MKIGFAQISARSGYNDNIEQCMDFMHLAHKLEINILCFPEMTLTNFFLASPNNRYPFQLAEGIPGSVAEKLQQSAKKYNLVVVLNYLERFTNDYYSSSPVIDSSGKLLGVSRMVHIPSFQGYYAQNYFTPSCGDFRVFSTKFAKIGVLISHDRHFPEATRSLALYNPDIILIPGYLTDTDSLYVYKAEITTIAYQNCVYVGMCNRVGVEDGIKYIGNSILAGPDGEIVIEGSCESELTVAEIDLDELKYKKSRNPFLSLRRPDEYLRIIRQHSYIK